MDGYVLRVKDLLDRARSLDLQHSVYDECARQNRAFTLGKNYDTSWQLGSFKSMRD